MLAASHAVRWLCRWPAERQPPLGKIETIRPVRATGAQQSGRTPEKYANINECPDRCVAAQWMPKYLGPVRGDAQTQGDTRIPRKGENMTLSRNVTYRQRSGGSRRSDGLMSAIRDTRRCCKVMAGGPP